ncbi:MAG: hypothetical protein GDA51_01185 [Ekhidna sp.]|nr:hypothetical protein [Ekhidna sp.]
MLELSILSLPILGAYFFLSNTGCYKYYHKFLDKQRLIYSTLLWSAYFLLSLFIITLIIDIEIFFSYFSFKQMLIEVYKEVLIIACLLSFVLAHLLPPIINFYNRNRAYEIIADVINKLGNDLHKFLWTAFTNDKLIMISLKDSKVYIGFVDSFPDCDNFNFPYFKLFPLYSGYRSDQNRNLYITTNYFDAYENLKNFDKLGNIEKVIKTDELISVSFFNKELYDQFNYGSNKQISNN